MKRKVWIGGVVLAGSLAGGREASRAATPDGERDASRAACARTPAAALRAAHGAEGVGGEAAAETRGYRVEAVRWDPILRQSWALVRSCEHQDRPSLMVATDLPAFQAATGRNSSSVAGAASQGQMAQTVVRSGDRVRLWKSDRYAHIEMTGTSEESGAVGTRVRVRMTAARDSDGQLGQAQYLAGVVRGPEDVEMER